MRQYQRSSVATGMDAVIDAVLLPALEEVPRATLPDRSDSEVAPLFSRVISFNSDDRITGMDALYNGVVSMGGSFLIESHAFPASIMDQLTRYALHLVADRIKAGDDTEAYGRWNFLCMNASRVDGLHPKAQAIVQAGTACDNADYFDTFLTPGDRRDRVGRLKDIAASLPDQREHELLIRLNDLLRVDDLTHWTTAWASFFEESLLAPFCNVDLRQHVLNEVFPHLPDVRGLKRDWHTRTAVDDLEWVIASPVALYTIMELPSFDLRLLPSDWGQPRLTDPAAVETRSFQREFEEPGIERLFQSYLVGAPALGVFPELSVIDRMDHLQALDAASAGLSGADRPPLFAPIRDCIARDVLGETEARWDALVAEALIDPPLDGPVPDVVSLLRPEHRLGPEPLQRAMARALAAAKISRALDRKEEEEWAAKKAAMSD